MRICSGEPPKKGRICGEPLEKRVGAVRPRGVGRSNPVWREYGIMVKRRYI